MPKPQSADRLRSNAPFVEMVRIADLVPYDNNPRKHSPRQIKALVKSLTQFGVLRPVLIDGRNVVVCGHAIVEAAPKAGFDELPAIRVEHLSPDEIRAYRLADNRLAELAQSDPARLAVEFEALAKVDFDLDLTGYSAPEIDMTIALAGEDDLGDEDDLLPAIDETAHAITQPGDLWLLGERHRLLCADARDTNAFTLFLEGKQAQMAFADPPYNVAIAGHVSGLGRVRHREFAMASGEMSRDEFTAFLGQVFANMRDASCEGAVHFACIDWRHIAEMLAAGEQVYSDLLNICVWSKTNAGMGSLYRSRHELVCVFKSGIGAHINNVELGRHGRNRSNVWCYPGANALTAGGQARLALHPTVKPVAMVADAMRDCSKRGGIVLDPFVGSGTLFIAAERTGRVGYGMELDPLYVDAAVRRWEALTGETARHAQTGLTFDETANRRSGEDGDREGDAR